MEAAPPSNYGNIENIQDKAKIKSDLIKKYKEILKNNWEGRTLKDGKINSWLNKILIDAKEYFIEKYPNYDIFIFVQIVPDVIDYLSNANSIYIAKTDGFSFADYQTDEFYCLLRFMFFVHYDLDYSIEEYEDEIIQKGDEILRKYLEDREYIEENVKQYNLSINEEFVNFILTKENSLRVCTINKIYKKPIEGKYFFKYLCHGKNVNSKIMQTYENNNLRCVHFTFFFK